MCSFCTHGQKQYTKKSLYKGLLMFIELFELENKFYTVNIFIYILCCFIKKRNCFCLLYIYSIALVVAKW